MSLYRKLKENAGSDMYPFHMPGHKRQLTFQDDPYALDITEIGGFDDLHHAEGILKDAQQEAADLYGARRAWYLVNGSTCGILSAVSAAVPRQGRILTARNCHKAVYHALYLRELLPEYIYPEITSRGLQGQITPRQVEESIRNCPEAKAMVLTSPTYDGVVSDIRRIAELLHSHDMALIVDQAHGAHFGLDAGQGADPGHFPENAGKLGADVVIVSVHKTLPSFTQTALLLQYTDRIPAERLEEFLDIYETSSPSYILMAGIERSLSIMKDQGPKLLCRLHNNLVRFYQNTEDLKVLQVLKKENFKENSFDFDDSKILIMTDRAGISGPELAELLRRDYHIEPEMAAGTYILALATVMDTEEGFRRLADALKNLDRKLYKETDRNPERNPDREMTLSPENLYRPQKRFFELYEKDGKQSIWEEPDKAIGRTAMDFIYFYPPGIPIVVPGERIGEELPAQLKAAAAAGLEVCGPNPDGRIRIDISCSKNTGEN